MYPIIKEKPVYLTPSFYNILMVLLPCSKLYGWHYKGGIKYFMGGIIRMVLL